MQKAAPARSDSPPARSPVRTPAKKPKAEPKKKKFGRGPQRAGSGICYNPLCPTRNNYRGAWSCTECRFCPERKFARQSRREIITI